MEAIPIQGTHERYFDNPFAEGASGGEALATRVERAVTPELIQQWIDRLVEKITKRKIKSDEYAAVGPYTGVSGIAYALHRVLALPALRADAAKSQELLTLATHLLDAQLQTESSARAKRYLTGNVGLRVVNAVVTQREPELAQLFRQLVRSMPDEDEVLNGKAGTLFGSDTVRTELGCELLTPDETRALLRAIIKAGREHASKHHRQGPSSSPPLMWEWHGKEYLGAAHGAAGILQALFNYWEYVDEEARSDIKQTLNWFISLQAADGNFPSSTGHIGESRHDLVHWCHGAPGVVHLLVTAASVFQPGTNYGNNSSSKDDCERCVGAARRCAELIWQKGLLRKGPGICHGVAGNAYAFLLLHRLTGETDYLRRAKLFAAVMMEPSFESAANTPDAPFSLFEGWAGALCFLVDLLAPDNAQFPLCPIVNFKKRLFD